MSPSRRTCLFRTDGGIRVGMGHLSRSLAIARALRKLGIRSVFVIEDTGGLCERRIRKAGFSFRHVSTLNDASFLEPCRNGSAIYFIDHYRLARSLHQAAARFRGAQMIDWEAAAGPHRLIVFPVVYARRPRRTPIGKTLVGPDYYPLDAHYRSPRPTRRRLTRRSLYLSLGGTAKPTLYTRVLEAIPPDSAPKAIEVLLGHTVISPRLRRLRLQFRKFGCVVTYRRRASNPWKWMQHCNAAIVAPGISAYELAAVGTACAYAVTADNQRLNAKTLNARRWGVFLGDLRTTPTARLRKNIRRFLRKDLAVSIRRPRLDGKGAERVALALRKLFARAEDPGA